MARIPGFVGPANQLQSLNADAEDTINFYYEQVAPGTGKSESWMPPTPGLRPYTSVPLSPCSQLFEQDGRSFLVAGTGFYELSSNAGVAVFRGTVAVNDGFYPTICSNGTAGGQLMVTAGGLGYIFNLNTNVLTQIADPDFPVAVVQGAFMDGYFIVIPKESRSFQISALENGTSWDALDVGERSEGSDNIVSLIRSHREIWLLGTQTTEVWYDNGDPDFPFAPIQGVFIEQGCAAPFATIRLDNTIIWVGKNEDGAAVVWRADGYTPKRISTHAVELDLQRVGVGTQLAGSTLPDIRAWGYQETGHLFYNLLVPETDWTWSYDVATGLWHKRARWDSTHCVWLPNVVNCHCFAWGKHLVGDRFTGTVYEMSNQFFTEEIVTP